MTIGIIYVDIVPLFLDIFYSYNRLIPIVFLGVYISSSHIKSLLSMRVTGIIEYFIAFSIYPNMEPEYRHMYHNSLILLCLGDGIAGIFHQNSKKTYINPQKSYKGFIFFCLLPLIYFAIEQYIKFKHFDIQELKFYLQLTICTGLIELLPTGEHDNIIILIYSLIYQLRRDYAIQLLIFSYIAFQLYQLKCFTYDGAIGIVIIAMISYNLNKLVFFSIITFGLLGTLSSKINKKIIPPQEEKHGRTILQVRDNSIVSLILIIIYQFKKSDNLILAAVTAEAECISDTFSSDFGTILNKNKYVHQIIGFKKVPKGQNGGVSLIGFVIGIFGALILSLLDYYVYQSQKRMLIIIISALIGNIFDSILGQLLQGNGERKQILSNGQVNLISSLISSLISLILYEYF